MKFRRYCVCAKFTMHIISSDRICFHIIRVFSSLIYLEEAYSVFLKINILQAQISSSTELLMLYPIFVYVVL